MCEDSYDGETPARQTYRWQRSRKLRECCACEREIVRGTLYHYSASLCDGSWAGYAHCAACWRIVEHLWTVTDAAIHIELNCGITHDAPPDDPGHALAFMTDAEAQAWAEAQPRESSAGGSWVG